MCDPALEFILYSGSDSYYEYVYDESYYEYVYDERGSGERFYDHRSAGKATWFCELCLLCAKRRPEQEYFNCSSCRCGTFLVKIDLSKNLVVFRKYRNHVDEQELDRVISCGGHYDDDIDDDDPYDDEDDDDDSCGDDDDDDDDDTAAALGCLGSRCGLKLNNQSLCDPLRLFFSAQIR
jgi:hypothetical protein